MIAGGRMPWQEAREQHLEGYLCFWQDLDGAHIEQSPQDPPLTSVMWGWPKVGNGPLIRLRLDGATAYLAFYQPAPEDRGELLVAWGGQDKRVRQVRFAGGSLALSSLRWRRFSEPVVAGTVPVTFLALE